MKAINALPTPQITKKNASPTTMGASQVRQDASAPHPRSTPREITWIVNAEKAVPNAAWMGLYGIRGYLTVGALAAAADPPTAQSQMIPQLGRGEAREARSPGRGAPTATSAC